MPSNAAMSVSPVMRIAAFGKPWKRQLVLTAQDQGDAIIGNINEPSIMGEIISASFDTVRSRRSGAALIVKLYGGALQSVSLDALLAGANTAAVRATNGIWEIIQFQTAEEVSLQTWRLTGLLRGQRGTQDAMRAGIAVGAPFVVLDASITEFVVDHSFSGGSQLRIGPANKIVTDLSWQTIHTGPLTRSATTLAPEHLRVTPTATSAVFKWMRCGRIKADDWDLTEIPLGEENEAYTVTILNAGGIPVRSTVVTTPEYHYLTTQKTADLGAATAGYLVKVQQNGSYAGLSLEAQIQIV